MSSYKAGKPIFIVSIVVLALVVVICISMPVAYFIFLGIRSRDFNAHLNIDYYEQIILKTDKITAVYQGIKYENLDNGFREYYSESHKTPVDESSSMYFASESDSFFVCVSDGNYTFKATYKKNVQHFLLYCVAASYSDFEMKNFTERRFFDSEDISFEYNSVAHFNNLISYFVQ